MAHKATDGQTALQRASGTFCRATNCTGIETVCVCVCGVCARVCVCACVCVRARARVCVSVLRATDLHCSRDSLLLVYSWSIVWDVDRKERGGKVSSPCCQLGTDSTAVN
jgi:hypothetical protein